MAPPKYSDLHKDVSDAFKKGFTKPGIHLETSQAYCFGTVGNGKMKTTMDFVNGAPTMEVEAKHNQGSGIKCLKDMVITKTMKAGSSDVGVKFEKACAKSGIKATLEYVHSMENFNWVTAASNPKLTLDYSHDKVASTLKLSNSDFMGVSNANFSTVTALGAANLGVNLAYDLGKQKLNHEVKVSTNVNGCSLYAGVTDGQTVSLLAKKSIGKDLDLGKLTFGVLPVSANMGTIYLDNSYNINNGNWNSKAAWTLHDANLFGFKPTTMKQMYDIKSNSIAENCTFSVCKGLNAEVGWSSNFDQGFFEGMKVGAKFNFNF